MAAEKYSVQYGNYEQYKKLLKVVKNGDTVTYTGVYGENDDGPIANITMVWMDELDRPQNSVTDKETTDE